MSIHINQVINASRIHGVAFNGGHGGEFIFVGTERQIVEWINHIIDRSNVVSELREEVRVDDLLIKHRNDLLRAIGPCPDHGDLCVPFAMEWIEHMKANPTDALWRGKRPMPTPQELREWALALRLGTANKKDTPK